MIDAFWWGQCVIIESFVMPSMRDKNRGLNSSLREVSIKSSLGCCVWKPIVKLYLNSLSYICHLKSFDITFVSKIRYAYEIPLQG